MSNAAQAVTDRRVQVVCLLILTFIAVGAALYFLKPVLVPFVLAVFFTYCLSPVIELLTRYLRLPSGVAIVVTAVLGIVILALLGFVIAASIGRMSQNFDTYQAELRQITEQVAHTVPLERLGFKTDDDGGVLLTVPENAGRWLVSAVLTETTNVISNGALVVIFMLFMLLGRKGPRGPGVGLLADIEQSVKRYTLATAYLSGLTGVLVGGALAILHVEFAGVFGFLAFLLNFIPSVGAFIATLLPLPIVLLSPELSPTAKVLAIAVPGVIQAAIGVVQPRIQGGALRLHPVVVLMALIFFGMIWGIVGAFVATPIMAVVKIILERISATRPVAELLAGNLEVLAGAATTAPQRNPPAIGA